MVPRATRFSRIQRNAAFAALGLLFAGAAHAQWQWKDENGRMVYSDRPPPAGLNPALVIKSPPVKAPAKSEGKSAAPSSAKPESNDPVAQAAAALENKGASVQAKAPTLADREMESRKKALEAEAANKKAAEEAQRAARNKQACEDNKASLRTLESGVRIGTINAKGEREFLSDEQRQQRTVALRREIAENCK